MSDAELSYAGVMPCGCCLFVTSPRGAKEADARRTMSAILREGGSIERVSAEWVRENFGPKESCAIHRPKPKPAKQGSLFGGAR